MTDALPHPALATALSDLASLTLADSSLETIMDRLAATAQRTVPGAVAASITLLQESGASTVASTSSLACDLDERQYASGAGPCVTSARQAEFVLIPVMQDETRWPEFTRAAVDAGVGSVMSLPVAVQGAARAAINFYGEHERVFSQEQVDLAAALAAYVGVALANVQLYVNQSELAAHMQAALQSRAIIDQAKGVLMGARGLGSDEAFAALVQLSQETNRKVRDVAQAMVDSAAQGGFSTG